MPKKRPNSSESLCFAQGKPLFFAFIQNVRSFNLFTNIEAIERMQRTIGPIFFLDSSADIYPWFCGLFLHGSGFGHYTPDKSFDGRNCFGSSAAGNLEGFFWSREDNSFTLPLEEEAGEECLV